MRRLRPPARMIPVGGFISGSTLLPGRSRFRLAFVALWDILLAILVGDVVIAFLRILVHEIDNPHYSPCQQTGQPEIAPYTPGEEVFVQVGARKDQGEGQDADERKPSKIKINNILGRRH